MTNNGVIGELLYKVQGGAQNEEEQRQDLLVAVIITLESLSGIVINSFVLLFVGRIDVTWSAFVKLTMSQALSDLLVLAIFLLHAAPMTYFATTRWLSTEWLNRLFGEVIGLAYVACVLSHLAMALNRFTAIVTPARNRTLFTPRNTNLMLLAIWSLATLETTLYAIPSCSFVYSTAVYGFAYASTECGFITKFIYTFLQCIIVIIIVAILDTITIYKIHQTLKKVTVNSSEQQKRTRREARLFLQAFLQDSVFMIGLVSFMLVSTFMTTKWSIYFTTSFIWEMVHTCDGLITIGCNPELRAIVTRRQQAQKTQGSGAPKDVKTGLVTRHKISMKTATTTAVVTRKQCNW